MTEAIFDAADHLLTLSKMTEDRESQIDVIHLVMRADIVSLPSATFLKDKQDRPASVFDIDPVATVLAIPVKRDGLSIDQIGHEERDNLFVELIRSVIIRTTHDHGGMLVGFLE